MKAAIYARYSSENQSDKSIDDQIRVCRNYAKLHNLTIDDADIFTDEARSGSLLTRPGLQALEKTIENKGVSTVLVDDLSRLSRSNHQMLTLVLQFHYHQVNIISISDCIDTDDENSKLGIQLRGLVNELYLDDLRKKTIRGLEGQKLRGYSAGEHVYGYVTQPVGDLRLNKRGEAKHDGMKHIINQEEAELVKRIFNRFIAGISINKIAKELNKEKILTKRKLKSGWNTSTVSRILKNGKYIGIWDWRKTKNVRDPLTGKKRQILRLEKDHVVLFREDLKIIDQATWDKARARMLDLKGTWPVSKKKNQFYQQKSYVHTSPTHLFSGLMRCKLCEGAIVLISGKGSGYYGCYNAKRKTCTNTLLVSRKRVEEIIINDLKTKILTPDNVSLIYKKVEKLSEEELNTIPAQLTKKQSDLDKLKHDVENFLNFIRIGNLSKAVSDSLTASEKRIDELEVEIGAFNYQQANSFKAPPKEWIKFRLERLSETLNKNTIGSSLALKELMGQVIMEPIMDKDNDFYKLFMGDDKDFKPYYVAHTKIETLALLDEESKGSNWYYWRGRRDSNPRPPA